MEKTFLAQYFLEKLNLMLFFKSTRVFKSKSWQGRENYAKWTIRYTCLINEWLEAEILVIVSFFAVICKDSRLKNWARFVLIKWKLAVYVRNLVQIKLMLVKVIDSWVPKLIWDFARTVHIIHELKWTFDYNILTSLDCIPKNHSLFMIYHVSRDKDHVSFIVAINHNDIVFIFVNNIYYYRHFCAYLLYIDALLYKTAASSFDHYSGPLFE